jgi:Tripartite tricarboxylate transporter TctB family
MTEKHSSGRAARAGLSMRGAEIVVALILLGLGGLVIFDSVRLGKDWGAEGPQAGYFPFYIGLLICLGSVVTLAQTFIAGKRGEQKLFVEWEQLRLVMQVLLPACLFVLGIQLIGIYVASAAYIAVFMVWLGKYSWIKSVLLGIVISIATFMMFEVWFKVPLFKGAFNPLSIFGY